MKPLNQNTTNTAASIAQKTAEDYEQAYLNLNLLAKGKIPQFFGNDTRNNIMECLNSKGSEKLNVFATPKVIEKANETIDKFNDSIVIF